MQPEMSETHFSVEFSPDLFDEPRDHANQWDVSGIWFEPQLDLQDDVPGSDVE